MSYPQIPTLNRAVTTRLFALPRPSAAYCARATLPSLPPPLYPLPRAPPPTPSPVEKEVSVASPSPRLSSPALAPATQ